MQTQRTIPGTFSERAKSFSELYLNVREKERRIYTDDEVSELPELYPQHPHYKEWLIRGKSCKKLLAYLRIKNKPHNILEVGCGNGWLSAQMSTIHSATVTGLDITAVELEQGARVFRQIPNLDFVSGDIQSSVLNNKTFNVIVFAASIQYFPSVREILTIAIQHLTSDGEIHILDTHFYHSEELDSAQQRTRAYYKALGIPEMSNHYFHHCIDDLQNFAYRKMYNPVSLMNRLRPVRNPFYWICVKK